jgi:hypothetical protein
MGGSSKITLLYLPAFDYTAGRETNSHMAPPPPSEKTNSSSGLEAMNLFRTIEMSESNKYSFSFQCE